MDVSLKALNYFLTAVEAGSISAAAKSLHVVPSAVLAGVNQVERAFGLQLTSRSRSRGIALTASGHDLMPKIQSLVDEYRNLLKEGADLRTQLTGTLRVGYYAPVAPAFLPPLVAKIFEGNTDLDIKFIACDDQAAQEGLIAGTFDVIICFAENMKPEVTYQTLLDLQPYLLVPEGHHLIDAADLQLADIGEEQLILLDLPNIVEYYRKIVHDAGIAPREVCTATTLEMVRSLVAEGLGVSILHMVPLTDVAYNGKRVVALPLDKSIPRLRIATGYFSNNPRRLVRAFVDACHEYFESEDAQRVIVN